MISQEWQAEVRVFKQLEWFVSIDVSTFGPALYFVL